MNIAILGAGNAGTTLGQCMREGLVLDMDVYDATAWRVPGPLSEISVQKGSMPVKFPDFTRGKWKESRTSIL